MLNILDEKMELGWSQGDKNLNFIEKLGVYRTCVNGGKLQNVFFSKTACEK